MNASICHITAVHQPKDPRILYKECVSLARAGHQVKLLVANAPTMTLEGVDIVGVTAPYKTRLQRFRRVSQALYRRALDLEADVYHFHDPEFIPYARKLLKNGFKVIYDAHEDFPRQLAGKYYIPRGINGLLGNAAERYENRSARKFTHIITATDHIRDRFLKVNPNVTVVRNYPRIEDLPVDLPAFRTRGREIVYVGSITQKRGILTMLDAIKDLDVTFNLAGKFDSLALYSQMKSRSWFAGKVKEWGLIGYTDMKRILLRCRVGLVLLHPIPSYRVALPVKLFDYMGHGLPVVASNFPLWREIVEGNGCGLCVDPLDTTAIAQAITRIMNDETLASEMGNRGRNAVLSRYNWTTEEQTLLEVYNKVLRS